MTCKLSKPLAQTKLASLYKNNFMTESNGKSKSSWGSRSNSSGDCTIVEKLHSYHNRNDGHSALSFQKVEEEEKAYGNSLRAKRAHKEFTSPIIDNAKSPSSSEDVKADVSSHSFVTAKAKLVSIVFLITIPLINVYFHKGLELLVNHFLPNLIFLELKLPFF